MSQTLSHQRWDAWHTNCTHKDAHASIFFFCISGIPHARHIHAHFEFWGWPFHLSLLASFFLYSFLPSFLLVLLWKEVIPHSFVVTFHFSCSSSSAPVFYPAGDGCWIHVNVRCSACIYITSLVVSSYVKPLLAHRRQQSAGSAFQFHYRIYGFKSTWPCLIIEVLATRAKFLEPSGLCTMINCTFTFWALNVFGCSHRIMA